MIPAPCLTELLSRAGKAREAYLTRITATKTLRVVPFGTRAAVECAIAIDDANSKGDKRGGRKSTWAKAKFDRQIVAIAVTESAKVIYSDDEDIPTYSKHHDIKTIRIMELPLPPEAAQGKLFTDASARRIVVRQPPSDDKAVATDPGQVSPDR